MNETLDYTVIKNTILRPFCHDFGAVISILGGYSSILHMEAELKNSIDVADITKMLAMLFDYRETSESIIVSFIEYLTDTADPMDSLTYLLETANTMYEQDFKIWYTTAEEINKQFEETQQLDAQLTHQLVHHANQLSGFREFVIEEAHKF